MAAGTGKTSSNRRRKSRAEDRPNPGVVLIDKPSGVTSHDVVARMRWLLNTRRVGHGGTLDPSATGLLVMLIGRATKFAAYLGGGTKVYDATIRFGEATASDDADGEIIETAPIPELSIAELAASAERFVGRIEQVPPAVSAVRIDGQRAYKAARRGEQLEIAARTVEIASIEILDWTSPDLRVRVSCGTGTYIRSLARDWGRALGSAGHIVALRREQSGPYRVIDAVTLEEAQDLVDSGRSGELLRQADDGVAERIGRTIELNEADEMLFRHGTQIENIAGDDGTWAVFGPSGNLLGVAELGTAADGIRLLSPRVIMTPL